MGNKAKYLERPWLQHYHESIPSDVAIPERTLNEVFDEAVKKYGNKTAFIFYGSKITYQQLKDYSDRFATALYDLGVRKGDRVALLLLTCPQFVASLFGALKIGAIITPISPVYVSVEVKYQLEDSGADTIVCQDMLYDTVEKTGLEMKRVILTDIAEFLPPLKRFLGKSMLRSVYKKMEAPSRKILEREGFYQFKDLIKKYPPSPPKVAIDPKEDIAALPYSGGTTGWPKGVMITQYNYIAAISELTAFWYFLKEGKEVGIVYQPLYHIMGQMGVVAGLVRGDTMVMFTTPDLDDILSAIDSYGVTMFAGAPTVFELLRDHDKTDRVDWKRLKFILAGADALLEDTAKGWEQRTGVKIHEAYGMTENASASHISPLGKARPGSFGIPLPNTVAAIVDPESTEFLPPGEIGELIMRGPQMMKGYWNKPEETARTLVNIDGETWLRTGDLVKMSEDGYFYFYDRKKDMIKYKGYQVFAREVEEVISQHPQVKEVGVIGVPDPRVGENIKAIVILETEARGKVSEEDIMKFCEGKMAHHKVPKFVEFRGEIPKTDIGKVSRRELREE